MNPTLEEQGNKGKYLKESSLSGKLYAEAEMRYGNLLNRKSEGFVINPRAGKKALDGFPQIKEETEPNTAESPEQREITERKRADGNPVPAEEKTLLERESVVQQYYLPEKEAEEGAKESEAARTAEESGEEESGTFQTVEAEGEGKTKGSEEEKEKDSQMEDQRRIPIDRILDEAYESEVVQPSAEKTWFSKIGTAVLAGLVLGAGIFVLCLLWPEQTNGILKSLGIHWI